MAGRASRIKAESDGESATTRVSGFSGPKAFEHYLLCIQLVLRKQLRWLIEVQRLPEELERLVKDLWALRLQALRDKVSYDHDAETDAQSSRVFSSQSEGDSRTDTEVASLRRHPRRRRAPGPNLTELLCLIHLGILLLKIPLTLADMHRWCNRGEMLFYRAVKEVPLSMRDRLPGKYQDLLEQQNLIEPDTLHRKMLELMTHLSVDLGMEAPSINEPLVLYRWVKNLALPLEIYVAAQRLARLLGIDFAYDVVAKRRASMSMRFPEIRLMTLVVIATKLLFPFDDARRYPKSAADLTAMRLDWGDWCNVQAQRPGEHQGPGEMGPLTFEDAFSMTEAASLGLADERLDQYLDWYEGNIASEEVRERGRVGREAEFRRTLFRMFPTAAISQTRPPPRAQTEISRAGGTGAEQIIHVQAALRPQRIVTDAEADHVPRVGTAYPQYKTVEDLSGAAREFHGRASQLAGCSMHRIVRAVASMEHRLFRLEKDWKTDMRE